MPFDIVRLFIIVCLLNVLVISIYIVVHAARSKSLYNKIRECGVSSSGRLIGYKKTSVFTRSYVFGYTPLIEFYHAGARYEAQSVERFTIRPSEVGKEVEIIFSHEHLDKVVFVKDRHILDSYIFVFLTYFIFLVINTVLAIHIASFLLNTFIGADVLNNLLY